MLYLHVCVYRLVVRYIEAEKQSLFCFSFSTPLLGMNVVTLCYRDSYNVSSISFLHSLHNLSSPHSQLHIPVIFPLSFLSEQSLNPLETSYHSVYTLHLTTPSVTSHPCHLFLVLSQFQTIHTTAR